MNIYCDEDVSNRLPQALRIIGLANVGDVDTVFPGPRGRGDGVKDVEWIPEAGRGGWLVFTRDRSMLRNENEKRLLIEHRVGMVVLSAPYATNFDALSFLLRRWRWLERIDRETPRPFAYVTSLRGKPRLIDLRTGL